MSTLIDLDNGQRIHVVESMAVIGASGGVFELLHSAQDGTTVVVNLRHVVMMFEYRETEEDA